MMIDASAIATAMRELGHSDAEALALICKLQENEILTKRETERKRKAEQRETRKLNIINNRVPDVPGTSGTSLPAYIKNARAPAVIPIELSKDNSVIDKKINKKNSAATLLAERADYLGVIWKLIPKRNGDAPKPFKLAVCEKLIRGAKPEDIEAGIRAYAAYEQGRSSEFRKGATPWINQECWDADWSITVEPHSSPPRAGPSQPNGRIGGFTQIKMELTNDLYGQRQEQSSGSDEFIQLLPDYGDHSR